jgi:tetratricopeptide (TPR) repeat protein
MKRTITVEPKFLIPGAVVTLSLTLALGWRLGQRANLSPSAPAEASVTVADAPKPGSNVVPGATPAPTTPAAILDGIPDAGGETAAAKEVRRWRETARQQGSAPKPWANLGDALMQRSRDLVDPHDYDWAKLCYEQALKLDPKHGPALSGMAWVTGALHQFDASVSWANQAIAANPSDSAPYGLLGDAQLETGDYDKALESYQKMLDIRPDMASYSRGAHLLYVTGDTRKALWLMAKAVKAGGPYGENTAWCKAQMAEMLWNAGAVVPAATLVEDALKSAPKNYHLLTMRGRLREATRNPKGAVESYKQAIEISPQHAALVALGDLYLSLGQKEEAEKLFAQVEMTHQHHQNHGNHDELYMALFWADHGRNLDRAKAVVEKRLAEGGEPKGLADLDAIAWVYYHLGDNARAKKYIDLAVAKGSPYAARLYHAGMIYAKAGDVGRARQYLTRAVTLNPTFNPIQAKAAYAKINELGNLPAPSRVADARK